MNFDDLASSFQDVDYSDVSSWPYILKLTLIALIGVGILGAMYGLFYQPKLESIALARDKEIILKGEFEDKQGLAVNLPAYRQQMVEIKERFESVLRQLPEQSEVPALLTDISQAGVEQGLEFRRFKPSAPQQKNFYVRLPIQIEASGSYHQLAGFISLIANFQRVVTVGDLEIVRDARAATDGAVPLSFKAAIYTYHFSRTGDAVKQAGAAAARVQ